MSSLYLDSEASSRGFLGGNGQQLKISTVVQTRTYNKLLTAPCAHTREMVKVEIVEERDPQASPYISPASSRTSSSISLSSVESDSPVDESLLDRLAALKDIVPPTTRHSLASKVSKTASFVKRTTKFAGNVIWVVTTSALLIGLPLALILEDEAKVVAQENEMLAQQQGAQQVRTFLLHSFLLSPDLFQMVSGSSLYPPSPNAPKQGSQ